MSSIQGIYAASMSIFKEDYSLNLEQTKKHVFFDAACRRHKKQWFCSVSLIEKTKKTCRNPEPPERRQPRKKEHKQKQ